jgi:hypothetical protein
MPPAALPSAVRAMRGSEGAAFEAHILAESTIFCRRLCERHLGHRSTERTIWYKVYELAEMSCGDHRRANMRRLMGVYQAPASLRQCWNASTRKLYPEWASTKRPTILTR